MNRKLTAKTRRWLRPVLAVGLLLASGAALALGLGEIRVKSRPGQALLADIPVISSDPSEMEALRARLASAETFDRVGLQRPSGLVSELDFAVAVGDDGRPVIRVTSASPVNQAAVNFLIEVDWGQGRLVREYSALIDAPGVLAATPAPVVEMPVAAPSDQIVRMAEPVGESEPEADLEPAPAPRTAAAPASRPTTQPLGAGVEGVTVAAGQTLSQLARRLLPQAELNQAMQALLQANPEAFIGGNINRLKQGAVLRAPQAEEVAALDPVQAAAFVREQMAQWRGARGASAAVPPIPLAESAITPASQPTPRARRVEDARLQIAPPTSAGVGEASTATGIQSGGKGDMLAEQQLQQTREDLAAREAEVQELRAQVAELEKIKAQQDKLIQLKDSDLAAAQQKLASSQGSDGGTPAWLWAGLALLVAGLVVAWLLARRRSSETGKPPSRTGYETATLAAAKPVSAVAADAAEVLGADAAEAQLPALVARAQEEASPSEPAVYGAPVTLDPALNVGSLNPAPAGRERLELAVAYLDLGDVETARDLLGEVVAGGDPSASAEAAQLLRELG